MSAVCSAAHSALDGSYQTSPAELRQVLGLMKSISQACSTMAGPAEATAAFLEIVANFTGWPIAHAYQRSGVDGVMTTMGTWFFAPATDQRSARAFVAASDATVFAPGAGFVGRAAAEGRPITCPDVTDHPHFTRAAAARASGVRGCFVVPVLVEGQVEIVLEFFAREIAELDESLLELLTYVAERLAGTIEHLRHVRVLDAALSNMAQGLLMLDAELRMVVCNSAYLDLFGLTSDLARPGTHLSELRVLTGAHDRKTGRGVDETIPEREKLLARGERFAIQFSVADGRIIEAVYNPMGRGWVATYADITARLAAEARLAHMAGHDALTDLPNRTLFREMLTEVLATRPCGIEAGHLGAAVLCLDLDRFKAVNDTLGHAVGDALLREVAHRISEVVARHGATVARLGGDEFAVLVPRAKAEQLSALARQLIDEVGRSYDLDGQRVNVGLSIGISMAPNDGDDPGKLLRAADMALYSAKGDGRGTFRFFELEMDASMQERRVLELDLRHALAAGEFELHYQPVVTLDTDRISAFEALLRWRHPTRGLIPPADFIPLAEEIAFIVLLGEWVLREACREAATWPDQVRVAVNLSPVQFRSTTLVLTVAAALGNAGLDPKRLELEITEGVLLQNSETTLFILHQLKDLGVRIAMDDFGTGYSSLSYLRAFPFDKIKIDRSFIADITTRADAVAIVRAVTSLGASLGIATTAEGIETPEQLDRLRSEGCTEVQGYLFSRPTPGHHVPAMLAHDKGEARAGATNRASCPTSPSQLRSTAPLG